MPHSRREELSRHHPVHVTIRIEADLPSLRQSPVVAMIRKAMHKMLGREGFRIVAYSIQSNHLHLIIECDSRQHLANGMRSLQIRIAKGVNRLWVRVGRVFRDRYHDHVLKTPFEVRRAFAYVLNNHYKHGMVAKLDLDRCASGAWFCGWKQKFSVDGKEGIPEHVSLPATWLCKIGWRRHGLISLDEEPALPRVTLPPKLRKALARKRRHDAAMQRNPDARVLSTHPPNQLLSNHLPSNHLPSNHLPSNQLARLLREPETLDAR
ncbi:MAG: hypothetical protein GY949_18320 [Gammaproteobacteria bacterium]|nr:hypothetical protein [Gammaproteobacteria bacterium]